VRAGESQGRSQNRNSLKKTLSPKGEPLVATTKKTWGGESAKFSKGKNGLAENDALKSEVSTIRFTTKEKERLDVQVEALREKKPKKRGAGAGQREAHLKFLIDFMKRS